MGILNWCLYPVGQIDPVQIVSHKSADFSGSRELPHGHPHASWTFPLCLVDIPIIPCGHSQWVLVPCGHPQPFFLAKTYPATTCPVGIPNCCYMPCGHSQSSQFTLCPIFPVVISMPCGLTPITTNMPGGHFPFCPVGIPIPTCPVGIPKSSNAPWARATLSFSVKTYPAMTCPAGFPNGCLYALWAFPILIFHIVPHMTCGHQYALWAFPHGHQYAPWAFPILPCGYSDSHMPYGHSQQAPMPRGHVQRFLFQWRLTLPWHALRAFPMAAYMPCGHSQSWYFILCPIWLVVISTPCGLSPMATNMPCGHFPFCPVGIPFPICPVGIPNKIQCPMGTRNPFFFSEDLPCNDMPCGHSEWLLICPVGIPNPNISYCAPYDWWSSVRPVGFPPWPPICPVGISHSALWAFPYAYGHSRQAPMPVGISHSALWAFPFPYALWAFPTSANVSWAPSTLSFSVKIYPAMTCPVGFPNGFLYARWAFPILIFHTVPHMTCGHQYALLAYPHGHQYALWAFPFLPCGHSHFPYALWAFRTRANALRAPSTLSFFSEGFTCHDMPCGHSQLLLICPVGIPYPHISYYAPYVLWSSVSPVGLPPWPPICPVGIFHSILP